MTALLPFIIVGLTSGSVYGLAGVGLVLTYKTSRVFNLAHGALGTTSAFVFYFLHVQHGMPWPFAAAISVLVLGAALGLGFENLARHLSRAALVMRVAATVGILLLIEAVFTILYGGEPRPYPNFLPSATFRLGGAYVSYTSLIIVIISVAATAGLYVFFRTARMGKAMRAVVEESDLLDLAGTDPTMVRRWAWVIGCSFATLSGLLLAPTVNLDPLVLTLLVAQAFGAAAIGGFTSLPVTWAGGLGIGLVSAILTKYIAATSLLGGLPASVPFLALFLVLLMYPKRRLVTTEVTLTRPIPFRAPARVQWGLAATLLVVLLLVPGFAGFQISAWTNALTAVMLLLSLGLLVRSSGQISLCAVSFAAIGAVAFSKLAVGVHLPWLVALLLAGLVAVPIGALLAIPAIRLAGLYLALATFGFGLLLQDMFYQTPLMFGSSYAGVLMPLPHLSWLSVDSANGFYYVVLTFTVLTALLVVLLVRTRLGRLLRALADSPTALSVGGTSVNVTLVLVFCLSAFIAAVSGALAGMIVTDVSGLSYEPIGSLTLVALIVITVGGEPWYAVVGGLAYGLVPSYFNSANTSNYLGILFGVSAVLLATGRQAGMPARLRAWLDKAGGRKLRTVAAEVPASSAAASAALAASQVGRNPLAGAAPGPRNLEITDLTVQFGGLVAVSGLSITARTGQITGLIGPNGSGKTTTFNACSGLNRPRAGRIELGGREIGGLSPAARARYGLGRTFQLMQLYDSLTVSQNVALGREAAQAGARVAGQIVASPAERREMTAATAGALALCQLTELAGVQVALLPTGQRRLTELARCLAGPFDMLLLDEPSSGLDRSETEHFARILRRVVAERDVGILLVEHDMSLVLGICDDIYVMDFGKLLFHGGPAEVRESPVVQAAYLGVEAVPTADTSQAEQTTTERTS